MRFNMRLNGWQRLWLVAGDQVERLRDQIERNGDIRLFSSYVSSASADASYMAAFRQGLADLGHTEGRE
jgi:hypothetical protein